MPYSSLIQYENLRSVDSATLTGTYVPIGTPLVNPSSILKLVNGSNVIIKVSMNETQDFDVILPGGFYLYDITTNRTSNVPGIFFPQGTQFYVSGATGTGLIYLVTLYTATF